jgi:hypothetical protein
VAGNGSGADVEPVNVLGRELVGVWEHVRRRAAQTRERKLYLRLVLTVSTQPVDKGQQAEVIPHLRDSGFSFTRWKNTNLDCEFH